MDLFEANKAEQLSSRAPLATRMRPQTLDELVGQQHVITVRHGLARSYQKLREQLEQAPQLL